MKREPISSTGAEFPSGLQQPCERKSGLSPFRRENLDFLPGQGIQGV